MADWFKFYENDLDETRLAYAISKLPEVVSVWVGILSECCRHKSDTVRWGSNEIELFGFSRRLGISIPKVNEAVTLLCEITYVECGENSLKVLKWTEKQSEYCQKKTRSLPPHVQTKSGHTTDKVVLEERRGEEKRGERDCLAREVPTEQDAIASTMTAGIPEAFSKYVYADWASRAGKDAGGVLVGFLPYVCKRWAREQVEWKAKQHKGTKIHGTNSKPNPRNAGINLDSAWQSRQTVEFLARKERERLALQNQMATEVAQAGGGSHGPTIAG